MPPSPLPRDYQVRLADVPGPVLIQWTSGKPWAHATIRIERDDFPAPPSLVHPGLYTLPDFKLIYRLDAGCRLPRAMVSEDGLYIAEWEAAVPPGLKCYDHGKFTGFIPAAEIFQRYNSEHCFPAYWSPWPMHIHFTGSGELSFQTRPHGWAGGSWYSEKVSIDVKTARLLSHSGMDWLAVIMLAGIATCLIAFRVIARKQQRQPGMEKREGIRP